ncbi:hypothetical protein KI688_010384 [Linnemannia hyalina]|uniref:F-box domain-containing protein n=1 Tax=Linnemannia hyalina TaxID=64524 RepID=A0A9P7Y1A4_9FUNG|nr:hypothetical protein KI688_010384 [Linnemannia hyalina]
MATKATIAPTTAAARNPFEVPELIHRLGRFVTLKDACSCALVSKTWTNHFMSAAWFSVDFNVHPRFADLSPAIITKNGHLIRVVKNAKSLPQVTVLANASVRGLKDLHIDPTASVLQHVRAYEIVHRNNNSLQDLHLFATLLVSNIEDSLIHYVSTSALTPSLSETLPSPSRLRSLEIQNMCLTHDGLAAILQGCPKLSELKLPFTDIVGTPTQSFQHTGVTLFFAFLKSIYDAAPGSRSLLDYFPALTTLSTYSLNSVSIPASRIKEDTRRYCPYLTGYRLQDQTGAIVPEFLVNIAHNISEIVFVHKQISLETITAILLHQSTLTSVLHFYVHQDLDLEEANIAPVSTHFEGSSQYLQLIPRCCSRLDILDLHFQEMNMDVVEQGSWVCKDISTLRIRIKGLDTEEKILKAIALWRKGCWRRWQRKAGTPVVEEEGEKGEEGKEQSKTDLSIEARVAPDSTCPSGLLELEWWADLTYDLTALSSATRLKALQIKEYFELDGPRQFITRLHLSSEFALFELRMLRGWPALESLGLDIHSTAAE